MLIKELIEILKQAKKTQHKEIYIASDPAWNSFGNIAIGEYEGKIILFPTDHSLELECLINPIK